MEMMAYSDTLLIPLSLFISIGYHAYLWHCFKHKPLETTVGLDSLKRKGWLREMKEGDDKKGMLAVQSLRNTLMVAILTATIAVLVMTALGALINNAFKASHVLKGAIFGSTSERIYTLKYGSVALFLMVSFFCSSMGIGFLVDANFLINAKESGDFEFGPYVVGLGHTQTVFERGFVLALLGNRTLCITFTLLLWTLGPLPVALSSVALVWVLYGIDFAAKFTKRDNA